MTKRLPEIEFRHLRYFVAAAEQGSFRRAGLSLAVQESAISRRIRDLEDQLGASLFQRHNGGVRLTLAGERFLVRAKAALDDFRESIREVAAFGRAEAGRIRIGILPAPGSAFLMKLLRAYDRQHAGVDIDFVEGGSAEHVAAIRRHELDVAFLAGIDGWSGCDMMLLWTEQVFVALSDKHRLAGRSELDWHHLAGECLAANQASAERHCHPPIDNRFVGLELCSALGPSGLHRGALLPLVALGRVLTLASETMATIDFPGVTHRPIGGETLRFGAVWLPSNDNPALRRLLAMARRQSDRSRC